MPHILLLETKPIGGFEIVQAIKSKWQARVTLVTQNLDYYSLARSADAIGWSLIDETILVPDSSDATCIYPAIERLHSVTPVDAILTLLDLNVVAAADLAKNLGCFYLNPTAARNVRNKLLTRENLAKARVPQPNFALARNVAEAIDQCLKIGFPVIMKPVDGVASINVKKIENIQEAIAHAELILSHKTYGPHIRAARMVLVEEYLEGVLVSAETLTFDGKHHLLGFCDKILSPWPTAVELGGTFPATWIHDINDVNLVLNSALNSVGFDFGPAHTELLLTKNGPKIIEINGRLAGGPVPNLINTALEQNIYQTVVSLHLEGRCDIALSHSCVCANRAFYVTKDGTVDSIFESPLAHTSEVVSYSLTVRPGDRVRTLQSNFDRLGFIITRGSTRHEAQSLADKILSETKIHIKEEPTR